MNNGRNLSLIGTERFNTNNGWGFGGSIGTQSIYSNGLVMSKGKYCYRHLLPQPFVKWYYNSENALYEITELYDIRKSETNLYEVKFVDEDIRMLYISAICESDVVSFINNQKKFITYGSREIKNILEIKL
jgi:hypothetical protein